MLIVAVNDAAVSKVPSVDVNACGLLAITETVGPFEPDLFLVNACIFVRLEKATPVFDTPLTVNVTYAVVNVFDVVPLEYADTNASFPETTEPLYVKSVALAILGVAEKHQVPVVVVLVPVTNCNLYLLKSI